MTKGIPVPASAEKLLVTAQELTGIDLTDIDAEVSLPLLIKAFNDTGKLHSAGAQAVYHNILRRLCNRLRMLRDFALHPEIAEQKIKAPTVVISMPRTGSTKCHKVLAASGAFNWLPFWQCLNHSLVTGDRLESPQARIKDTHEHCDWFDQATPKARMIHQLRANEPEEDAFLLLSSLRFYAFFAYAPVDSYTEWLMTEDPSTPFQYLRDALKYLQWQGYGSADKPWLLKAPTYLGMEPVIRQVFPDARFVMTHRRLSSVVPSSFSLFDAYRKPYTDSSYTMENMAADMGLQMSMHMQNRLNDPALDILDVDYDDAKDSPKTVMAAIYNHSGLSFDEKNAQAVEAWEAAHPPPRKGFHVYSSQKFGLTSSQINKAFTSYLEHFPKYASLASEL